MLAIIPARGGSKGLKHKNILPIAGKPLIAWTIEAALTSRLIDRVILSSEDPEIIQVAKSYGCEVPFTRPTHLGEDDSYMNDALLHVFDTIQEHHDYFVLLQPTSPLRTVEDIDASIRLCLEKNSNSCVSMVAVKKNPHWMYSINKNGVVKNIIDDFQQMNRQDLPEIYALNGAVYVCKLDYFLADQKLIAPDTVAYVMPEERSYDIDTAHDFKICDYILSTRL